MSRLIDIEKSNEIISEIIREKECFFIPRLRGESFVLHTNEPRKILKTNAGLYPLVPHEVEKYRKEVEGAIKQSDAVCCHWFLPGIFPRIVNEDFGKKTLRGDTLKAGLFGIENAWTNELEGKRLLIVHPFVDSLKHQLDKLDKCFDEPPLHRDVTFAKAIQTGASAEEPHDNWRQSLDVMKERIEGQDFDVALIGCGVYDMPIGAFVKQKSKGAIITGGILQLHFGVYGHRWTGDHELSFLINDHWIRPFEHERPKGFNKVEDGAYW